MPKLVVSLVYRTMVPCNHHSITSFHPIRPFLLAKLPIGLLFKTPSASNFPVITLIGRWLNRISAGQFHSSLGKKHQQNMGISINGGTPKSSIFISLSLVNHPLWGTPIYAKFPHHWNPDPTGTPRLGGAKVLPSSPRRNLARSMQTSIACVFNAYDTNIYIYIHWYKSGTNLIKYVSIDTQSINVAYVRFWSGICSVLNI